VSRSVAEWIGRNDDAAIPPRVQERVADKTNDNCASCGNPAKPGQCDHIIPLILGGKHAESNMQWLCIPCHKLKTARDVKIKAKVARVRKRNLGIRKPRTMTRWRKFNGEVVNAGRSR
jgi:5-methylcytosine-specific restriction protein A